MSNPPVVLSDSLKLSAEQSVSLCVSLCCQEQQFVCSECDAEGAVGAGGFGQ